MYLLFPGASHKIAKNLIQVTGTQEIWTILRRQSTAKAPPRHLWKEILGLNVCNLAQTMLEESADRELDPEDRQDILEDFVMEILRTEKWVPTKDGAERMELCMEVLEVAERLKVHFNRTRVAQGLKARPEAVRDLLNSLGLETEMGLQKTLLGLVETQHQRFTDYFKTLFEPFAVEQEKGPESAPEVVVSPILLDAPVPAADVIEPEEELEPVLEDSVSVPPVSVDLDSLTVVPLTGLPLALEPQVAASLPDEMPIGDPPFEEVEVPPMEPQGEMAAEGAVENATEGSAEVSEGAWTEEGAVVEPVAEPVIEPETTPQPSPLDLSIQPLTRSRGSLSRSVDPQKLAKVLEYLLSPADSPLEPFPQEEAPVVSEVSAEEVSEEPVEASGLGSGEPIPEDPGGAREETADPAPNEEGVEA
jgi:hypothetical protein